MLFQDAETERLRALIATQSIAWTAEEVQYLLAACQDAKPSGYDKHQLGVRLRYEGRGRAYTEAALVERFPLTHNAMPRITLPWLRLKAAQDAGFYQLPPTRTADPEATTEALLDLVARSDWDATAPEFERRALAAGTMFAHVGYDQVTGRPRVSMYWPSDVGVVCHPSAPHDFTRCILLMARASSPYGDDGIWYNVWTREYTDADDGQPESFGTWRSHLISDKGDSLLAPSDPRTQYDGILPWVCVQMGVSAGSVYVDQDRDIVDVVDALNVSKCSEQYTLDMQGHTPVVYAGHQVESSTLRTGPDAVMTIGPGENLTTLALDPKLTEIRESRVLAMRELAITSRNSPDAYATEPGPPLSGVSRKIANAPHDQKVREDSYTWKAFEERQLLPVLVDVHNRFSGEAPINATSFTVTPRQASDFEDPEAKQRRLRDAVDAGWVTPARAAVECGLYGSIAEAEQAGVSNALKGQSGGLQPTAPFGMIADDEQS